MKLAGKWMDLEIILNEVIPTEKDENCMFSLIFGP